MSQETAEAMYEAAARTLWLLVWANAAEEAGVSLSQTEIDDVAPETPDEALALATTWLDSVASVNGKRVEDLGPANLDADELDEFVHYLVMEGAGEGVSWEDDHESHGLHVPDIMWYENQLQPLAEETVADDVEDDDSEECP